MDFAQTLSTFLKNFEERLSSLHHLVLEEKGSAIKFEKELRHLKSELTAINESISEDFSRNLEEFVRGAEEVDVTRRTLELIRKIIESTTGVFSKSKYYETILKILADEMNSDKGFILLFTDGEEHVEILSYFGFESSDLSADEYVLSRTLVNELRQRRKIIRVANALEDKRYLQETSILRMKVRSVILAPLFAENSLTGCVYLENHRAPNIYTETDEKLLGEISPVLSSLLVHPVTYLKGIDAIHARVYQETPPGGIIGVHSKFKKVLEIAKQVANSPTTVLIEGESGTGKEVVARYIHTISGRKDKPLVIVNCAAIPENLLESELFGHERGAFTGAFQSKTGKFEMANHGTIFLDEIGELPLTLQGKFLRFLQFQEFERLGGLKTVKVDVRVIAATSRNLKHMVEQGKFLDALYFRINVIPIYMPPLRDRGEDIIILANYFLNKFRKQYGKKLRLDPEVYLFFETYPFPGNIRELENLIHRCVVLCQGDFIGVEHLPQDALALKEKGFCLPSSVLL